VSNGPKRNGDDEDCDKHPTCLMLIRFADEYRSRISRVVPLIKRLSDEYMEHFRLEDCESTPNGICEGALTGEYDFYILFRYRGEGPVWLAARLHDLGIAAEVLTMQAMPRRRFEKMFRETKRLTDE